MELLHEDLLEKSKNLLAFSAGPDSTALFFLLLNKDIPFDIAIVDYGVRPQSAQEVAYAKELAAKYGKKIFVEKAPKLEGNFEAEARRFRYRFFEKIIRRYGYDTLLTAHHLGDRLEWFLMQLTKGAGVVELLGLESLDRREDYLLARPLLQRTKEELVEYLEKNRIPYFTDESNFDTTHFRNFIRHHYAKPLLDRFAQGIRKSFAYMDEDKKRLLVPYTAIKKLYIAPNPSTPSQRMRTIDRLFKRLGYLLSSSQKREILRQKEGVIAGKIAFAITNEAVLVAPYIQTAIPKKRRELYRKHRIPKVMRGYLYEEEIAPETIWRSCRLLRKR